MGAIVFDGHNVLLVERAGEPLKGYWSLPGGLLETGEKLEDAIKREVKEETGLDIEILSRFDIFERIMRDADGKAEYHYVLVDYICKATGGQMSPSSDVSKVAWIPYSQIRNYKVTSGTVEAVDRAYEQRHPKPSGLAVEILE